MRSGARRAFYQLLDELYLYEEMLEKRLKYSKKVDLRELLEEVKYLEEFYGFARSQLGAKPAKKQLRLKLIDF